MRQLVLFTFLTAAQCGPQIIAQLELPESPGPGYARRVRFWIEPPKYRFLEATSATRFRAGRDIVINDESFYCEWTERCEIELWATETVWATGIGSEYYMANRGQAGFELLGDWVAP